LRELVAKQANRKRGRGEFLARASFFVSDGWRVFFDDEKITMTKRH
jgi:hypothetical protein